MARGHRFPIFCASTCQANHQPMSEGQEEVQACYPETILYIAGTSEEFRQHQRSHRKKEPLSRKRKTPVRENLESPNI